MLLNKCLAVKKTLCKKKKLDNSSDLENIIKTLSHLKVDNNDTQMRSPMETDVNDTTNYVASLDDIKAVIICNDVGKLMQLLQHTNLEIDIDLFYKIGQYSKSLAYIMMRNSDILENYFNTSVYCDAIFEGISLTDNFDLMKHITSAHQLTHVHEERLSTYMHSLIENKAYRSLEILGSYLRFLDTEDSHVVIKNLLSKSIETLDSRIITIVMNLMKPQVQKPMAIEYFKG
jgi:hypothetical protein